MSPFRLYRNVGVCRIQHKIRIASVWDGLYFKTIPSGQCVFGNFLICTSIRHFGYSFFVDILAILGSFYLGFYSRVQTSRGRNSESGKGWMNVLNS